MYTEQKPIPGFTSYEVSLWHKEKPETNSFSGLQLCKDKKQQKAGFFREVGDLRNFFYYKLRRFTYVCKLLLFGLQTSETNSSMYLMNLLFTTTWIIKNSESGPTLLRELCQMFCSLYCKPNQCLMLKYYYTVLNK